MSYSSSVIQPLLERLSSEDSDYRFMSLSDLYAILSNKTITLSASDSITTVNRIIDGILKSLSDNNAEVQNLAVKCLAPLVSRISDTQLTNILNRLSFFSTEDEDSSLASTALRTIITSSSPSSSKIFIARLLHTLLPTLQSSTDSLDVLVDLLNKFGSGLSAEQVAEIQTQLISVLENGKGLVRKRAVSALGALSSHLTAKLWDDLMNYLIDSFSQGGNNDSLRVAVSVCSTLCKASHIRTGPYLARLAPNVLKSLDVEDDDVREAAIVALETLVGLCPTEMTAFTGDVIAVSSRFLKYDPNYAVNDEDDEEEMYDADSEEGFDEDLEDLYDDTGFSDEDDVSWKLRRGAAKLLGTLIGTRPDLLSTLYGSIAPLLVSRFKEREESVRIEVIHTFASLIRQTAGITSPTLPKRKRRMSDDSMTLETDPKSQLPALSVRVFKLLAQHMSKTPGIPTKQAALNCATELVSVLCNLPDEFSLFIQTLESVVAHGTLRTSVIKFFSALASHSIDQIAEFLPTIVAIIVSLSNDKFYRISSEALAVTGELVVVITSPSAIDVTPFIVQLHATAVAKATAHDSDLETREQAIMVIGTIMSRVALSSDEVRSDCGVLLERLRNETTRQVTIRALSTISLSKLDVAYSAEWINAIIAELASLLQKSNRSLRLSAVTTLHEFIEKFSKQVTTDAATNLLSVLRFVLIEDDLQLLVPVLSILSTLITVLGPLRGKIVDTIVELVPKYGSSEALLNLLAVQAQIGDAKALFEALTKADVNLTARAVAVVMLSGNLVDTTLACIKLEATGSSEVNARGALAVIAELARRSSTVPVTIADVSFLYNLFLSSDEEVKIAAAQALGAIAATNVDAYVPQLASQLTPLSRNAKMLVIALREAILLNSSKSERASEVAPYTADLWSRLFALDVTDNGIKSVAAECVGRLTALDPAKFIPDLRALLKSTDTATRSLVIGAVRFLFSQSDAALAEEAASPAASSEDLLRPIIVDFFALLEDSDLENRRLAISAITSVAYNRPQLVADYLQQVLKLLVEETQPRPELVREVQMGPFKHKVDDGLEARKAAYDALYAILVAFAVLQDKRDELGLSVMTERAVAGLSDDHDVKIIGCVMLGKIIEIDVEFVYPYLEILAKKFTEVITRKFRETEVKQEFERHGELQRHIVRITQQIQSATADLASPVELPAAWTQYVAETFSKVRPIPAA
ncbi:armadillo-type protein [Lipomyces arxii]|uniref:armadillo-type protein n=1 Tax=Lipomyces arxii TaxID=56418 RepID=UPI0034CFC8F3